MSPQPRRKPSDDDAPEASTEGTNQPTPDKAPADETALEHTAGGVTTRDGMDAGVPMTASKGDDPVGPEDAFAAGPTRGDYGDRLITGPSMTTEVIPEDEREPDGPLYRLVEQTPGAAAGAGTGAPEPTEPQEA